MRPLSARKLSRGFSLAETVVVMVIMTVLIAISAPSMLSLVDGLRLAESVSDVRSALMTTQRQAIRETQPCEILLFANSSGRVELSGTCLKGGNQQLHERVRVVSNIISTRGYNDPTLVASTVPMVPLASRTLISQVDSVNQGGNTNNGGSNNQGTGNNGGTNNQGTLPTNLPLAKIKFGIMGTAEFTTAGPPNLDDPTGKIIFYLEDNKAIERRCLAISNTLGLTRTGRYTGEMTREGITSNGVCRASEVDS
jgi:prepilin-type N-terminal cleavage/methylation domain-containing protein